MQGDSLSLERAVRELREHAEELAPLIQDRLHKLVKSQNIENAVIAYRIKEEQSILRKIERKHCRPPELTDILGFRIMVPETEHCYQILGAVNEVFMYLPHKLKDYVKQPKANGYQSLHTTFYASNFLIELQIRTHAMHQNAEHGNAQYRPELEAKTNGEFHKNGIKVTVPNQFPGGNFKF